MTKPTKDVLLNYRLTTDPDPVEVNSGVKLILTVTAPGGEEPDVYYKSIMIKIPTGDSAGDLCLLPEDIKYRAVKADLFELRKKAAEKPGVSPWKHTFYSRDEKSPVKDKIEIELNVAKVNQTPGNVDINIVERSRSLEKKFERRTAAITIEKKMEQFYVDNFISYKDSPVGETNVPCTEFENGARVFLGWEGSWGNTYTLYYGDKSIDMGTTTSIRLKEGEITKNTNIILKGEREDRVLFRTLNITIKNPDSTPETLGVKENAVVGGTLAVAGRADLKNGVTVTGAVNAGSFAGDGIVPRGAILMWSGSIDEIPPGWALCNGQKVNQIQTPDLCSRFIVGYSESSKDYDKPGKRGGVESVKLSVNTLPSHSHSGSLSIPNHHHWIEGTNAWGLAWRKRRIWGNTTVKIEYAGGSNPDPNDVRWRGAVNTDDAGGYRPSFTTTGTGGGGAHENRPPYFVLAFIMKL